MSTVQFTVALRSRDLDLLDALVERNAEKERAWLQARRKEHRGLRAGELAQARRDLRAELAGEREEGRLLGTRDLVVARALRAELTARDWDRNWPAPRPGAIGPGRRWGTEPGRYDHAEDLTHFKARMGVRLPAPLGEQLRRACFWHCDEIEKKLQEWADRWGDGPEVRMRRAERDNDGAIPAPVFLGAVMAKTPGEAALAERRALRAQIVTTGDVLRAAVTRAVTPRRRQPRQLEIPG